VGELNNVNTMLAARHTCKLHRAKDTLRKNVKIKSIKKVMDWNRFRLS